MKPLGNEGIRLAKTIRRSRSHKSSRCIQAAALPDWWWLKKFKSLPRTDSWISNASSRQHCFNLRNIPLIVFRCIAGNREGVAPAINSISPSPPPILLLSFSHPTFFVSLPIVFLIWFPFLQPLFRSWIPFLFVRARSLSPLPSPRGFTPPFSPLYPASEPFPRLRNLFDSFNWKHAAGRRGDCLTRKWNAIPGPRQPLEKRCRQILSKNPPPRHIVQKLRPELSTGAC